MEVGYALKFSHAQMDRYIALNRQRMTSEGTRNMLIDWYLKSPAPYESKLYEALFIAELLLVAEEHLGGSIISLPSTNGIKETRQLKEGQQTPRYKHEARIESHNGKTDDESLKPVDKQGCVTSNNSENNEWDHCNFIHKNNTHRHDRPTGKISKDLDDIGRECISSVPLKKLKEKNITDEPGNTNTCMSRCCCFCVAKKFFKWTVRTGVSYHVII